MTHEPGFLDTTLHRSLVPDARFQFINIAHWESVEAWQAAFAKHAPNAMLIQAGLDATPALYRVVVEYSHGP
jgi:heme-degrading monooxygenase HmoA